MVAPVEKQMTVEGHMVAYEPSFHFTGRRFQVRTHHSFLRTPFFPINVFCAGYVIIF
jgi:hypothetical protein